MKFTELKKRFTAYQRNEKKERKNYITNGYTGNNDAGLRRYLTETRWNQYQSGIITRKEAITYAVKRMEKELDKETAEKLAHLERIENAPDIKYIRVSIEWNR